jgi:hypothetical protein
MIRSRMTVIEEVVPSRRGSSFVLRVPSGSTPGVVGRYPWELRVSAPDEGLAWARLHEQVLRLDRYYEEKWGMEW